MNDLLKKTNYHMHTKFCDGNSTVKEMAQSALDLGMESFGFSGHAMNPFSSDWHMSLRDYENYCREVRAVKEAVKGKAEVYCGFEADFIPGVCEPSFKSYSQFSPDFLIGSVHYVLAECEHGFFEADGAFEDTRERIKKYFGGNAKKAVQAYFASQREMLLHGDFTFIGHCDLIRKQNSKKAPSKLFDENDSWYRKEIKATADSIAKAGVCVEINTGAMSRMYLESPYPSLDFLTLLKERNVPVTFASDAHAARHVGFGFDTACDLARSASYTELHYLHEGKLIPQKL